MGFARKEGERRASADTTPPGAEPLNILPQKATNSAAPAEKPEPRRGPQPVTRATVWLHRLSLGIFVVFCVELGMLLMVLPWTKLWTENNLLAAYPAWRTLAQDNFVRGAVSGIGLIDVWVGVWEAVHYRDPGKPPK